MTNKTSNKEKLTVIIGGKGKTGARVRDRLERLGRPVRAVSPSAEVPFDWNDSATWEAALQGAHNLYVTYFPDLAVPGAAAHVDALARFATERGVDKIVLLAGRGEPQVHPAEDAIRTSGARWTIFECGFFMQNFTEGALVPQGDTIAFPAGDVREPLIDCDDIADAVVAALVTDDHVGKTYELTGPRLLTFGEATAELAEATGRPLAYVPVTFDQYRQILGQHVPPELAGFFVELFSYLLDGHNAHVTDDLERVLGRPPRDFRDFARAASGSAPAAGATAEGSR